MSIVLTLDLGTSTTKAALWSGTELVGLQRAPLLTVHPAPGYAEQEPESWWDAVVDACGLLRDEWPHEYAAVEMIACSAARETFGCFDGELEPVGSGVVWSDSRAVEEAGLLGDPAEFRAVTGVLLTPGCAAAKVAWVATHEPDRFASTRWVLAPRDYVIARLTGSVVTEPTLASRTGWYSLGDTRLCGDALASRLPTLVTPVTKFSIAVGAATRLGLDGTVRVIPGAGDRTCEVLGSGATPTAPMTSWGTNANVAVPHDGPIGALPPFAQVSRGIGPAFVVEAGLSAAAEAMTWLAQLTHTPVASVWSAAATVPSGADGVRAQAWFNGARSPWWQPDARAAFSGLTPETTVGQWARALVESVAFDVARSVALIAPDAAALMLAGAGAANPHWRAILGGVTDLALVERRHTEAGSVGARLLAADAMGLPLGVDAVNPVIALHRADPELVDRYRTLRADFDATTRHHLP